MKKKSYNESMIMSVLAKSVEHFVEEAALSVESELCSRCPANNKICRKPCLTYQRNFDEAMSRLVTMTSQWN
jgi:hypothetical protein